MRSLSIESLVVPPIYSNCYILHDGAHAVIVDPGGLPKEIMQIIRDKQLQVEAILNTHGHIDHIGANAEIRRQTGAPIYVHPKDAEMLSSSLLCGAEWAGLPFEEHHPDQEFTEGQKCNTGHFEFDVIHTPGHSPGSVCLILPEAPLVFSGDLVFMDSIGRYDLPGGDEKTIMASLRRFLSMSDEYKILSGHGAPTTVERERKQNPFLKRLQ